MKRNRCSTLLVYRKIISLTNVNHLINIILLRLRNNITELWVIAIMLRCVWQSGIIASSLLTVMLVCLVVFKKGPNHKTRSWMITVGLVSSCPLRGMSFATRMVLLISTDSWFDLWGALADLSCFSNIAEIFKQNFTLSYHTHTSY